MPEEPLDPLSPVRGTAVTTRDPLPLLRQAAVAKDAALADAFALYEQAVTLKADEEGWCIVASFEEDEQVITAFDLG